MVVSPVVATAQEASDGVSDDGTILVTARKREESLIEVPVSIQAFTAKDLEQSKVTDLQDLSRYTPSLSFVNGTQGQGGRYLSEVRFRGLSTALPTPTNQTGSAFVDGIFVLGGAQSIGFEDIQQVEVIKGPQAAYFGRSTFAGAVNFITKDPGNVLKGDFSADYSPSFGSYALTGAIEGPVIGDVLSARLSGSTRLRGAQYTSTDGGKLGEEKTDAINLTLLFKPTDRLKIKLRGSYIEDNDGPAASGFYRYDTNTNCPIGTPITVTTDRGQLNTTLGKNFRCGDIPYNAAVINPQTAFQTLPAGVIPAGQGIAAGPVQAVDMYNVFVNNSLNDPLLRDAPTLKRFGLTRQSIRLAGSLNYEFSDALSFTLQGGYNRQDANAIRDTDGTSSPASFQVVPYRFVDKSVEGRFNYDGGWFKATAGINYFRQDIRADTDNGISVVNAGAGTVNGVPTWIRSVASSSNNENDTVKTTGFFGGLDITPVPWATLTLEGRYQIDDYIKYGGNNYGGRLVAQPLKSKNFTPRAILSLHPMDDSTIYASYSRGVLPGTANTNFLALSDADKARVRAVYSDFPTILGSEKLTNYEIGYKQHFRDLRLTLSVAAFKMDWDNIKATASITVPGLVPNEIFSVTLPGKARIKGFEFEGNWQPIDQLSLRATAGYINAKYTDYANRAYNSYFGVPSSGVNNAIWKADGNRLPRTPDWSASGTATWSDALTANWDYRLRGDVLYAGSQFTDESNFTSIAGYVVFNAAVAIENKSYTIELYAKNLFDKNAWMTGRRFTDTSTVPSNFATAGQGSFVTPIDRREIGMSVRYRF
jgi:iron complex outermembrane receptor protein